MANLKIIRKRIVSVKNTQKITKAMKMVAAAKLKRAQNALMQARPYADLLMQSMHRLVTPDFPHPLLKQASASKKALVLIFSSDRGLCGGFNSNLFRKVAEFIRVEAKDYEAVEIATVGRKGRDYYKAKHRATLDSDSVDPKEFNFAVAKGMADKWIKRFQAGEFDVVYLAYNHFNSAISQTPYVKQVLPLVLKTTDELPQAPVVWEGGMQKSLDALLSRYAEDQFFLAVLDSQVSELGARMSAMDSATNNASDMISSLTLQYNRARQAAITMELMDIVNGAEAL